MIAHRYVFDLFRASDGQHLEQIAVAPVVKIGAVIAASRRAQIVADRDHVRVELRPRDGSPSMFFDPDEPPEARVRFPARRVAIRRRAA